MEEIKNNPNPNPEKEVKPKEHNCYHCAYFRLYSVKLTDQSKKFDGFCSKRKKPKLKNDVCKCFSLRK